MAAAVLGMLKSSVGTAILSVPNALRSTGLVMFPLLLFGFMVLAQFGCMLVTKTLDIIGINDSDPAKVGEVALGKWGKWITLVLTFLDPWMSVVAYLTALCDIVKPMIAEAAHHEHTGWYSTGTLVLCMSVFVFPFMLYTDITHMSWVNILGMGALIAFIVAVMVNTVQNDEGLGGVPTANFNEDAIIALSVIAFAYDGCQMNVFPFYRDLQPPRDGKKGPALNMITLCSNFLTACVYYAIAMMANACYGDALDKDVLNNFGNTEAIYIIIKSTLAIAMLFTIPITMFECTNVLREHVVGSGRTVNIILNAVLLGTAAIIAAFIPNMYLAFAYVGATTATAWTMILPPLWYICCVKKCFGCYFPDENARNKLIDNPELANTTAADAEEGAAKLLSLNRQQMSGEVVDPSDDVPPPLTMYLAVTMLVMGCLCVPFFVIVTSISTGDGSSPAPSNVTLGVA
eukprot:TRINITY_DN16876_c0_g1_i1.p1 TRINITY_DN16876_c0_g1~~TRINITY_DN16876_c0_g1_i1.p1  ORF type:complete len:504 (+),score=184.48 TRINITY_DN16876_c0_g1_i1:138-1514(+)